jgi:6-phosphogluconolactonase
VALLTIAPDEQTLAERVAERFLAIVADTVRTAGLARVCLTGGNTPKRLYELLATNAFAGRIDWERMHVYWSDERHVAPDHKDSNYGMTRDALLMHVPIPAAQVHRIRGELPADEGARLYERELPERFDLMLLGLGEDAHIASIFPRSPVLSERERRAAAVWVPHLKAYRITLTPPPLVSPSQILMLVSGDRKAAAVAAAIHEPDDPLRYPVHTLRRAGDRVQWFIDRAAARDVSAPHGRS